MSNIRQPDVTEEALETVAKRLATAIAPRRVYLFGSHARGDAREHSDVDLMIVLDDETVVSLELLKRAQACLRGMFIPFELHFRTVSQFDRRTAVSVSVEHDVAAHGRLLYAA